jgi:hypothetical protein
MRFWTAVMLAACSGSVEVDEPAADAPPNELPADCHEALEVSGVTFTVAGATEGVDDPVTAQVPIAGMSFRVLGNDTPRTKLFADCRLILSLVKAAPIMKARNIVEVSDLGVYNYRCIGGGTPPDCPNGISQHAFAMAIDLAGFSDGSTFYSVNDDWVIDPDAEDTCTAPTEGGKDAFLHDLICALKGAGIWNIVLTPNYNADHRNHFHVDLTPDSDFIERRIAVGD